MKHKYYVTLLHGLAALCLWCTAITAAAPLQSLPSQVQLRWPGAPVTAEMLQNISASRQLTGRGVNFSAWRQQAAAFSSSWGRAAQGQGVWYWGRGEQVFPTVPLVCGRWSTSREENLCMVSESLAQALWGSSRVQGLPLTVQGRQYAVAGVMAGLPPVALLPATPQEAFSALVLFPAPGENQRQAAQSLVLEGRLPQGWQLLPVSVPQGVAALALSLPPALLGLGLVLSQWKKAKQAPSACKKWAGLGAAALLAALCAWALGFPWHFPQDFIPTRWSDFSFWGQSAARLSAQLSLSFSSEKLLPDLPLWHRAAGAALLMCASAVFALVWAGKAAKQPRPPLGLRLALAGLFLLSAWGLCFFLLGEAASNRAFLLLPSLAAAGPWPPSPKENRKTP